MEFSESWRFRELGGLRSWEVILRPVNPLYWTVFSCEKSRINYVLPLSANLRPILPKQTQLQNITLAIHVATPMVSLVIIPSNPSPLDVWAALAPGEGVAGEGTIPGLTPSNTAVPVRPTTVERMKPGLERSMRYHNTGLTSARVRETWRVDCHGSLRYRATH